MEETGEKIIKINIEEEMKTAYIDYSMSGDRRPCIA